jgi:hypothetical protein
MQSLDPGFAVAERDIEPHERHGLAALSFGRERVLPALRNCGGSSRMALRRGF